MCYYQLLGPVAYILRKLIFIFYINSFFSSFEDGLCPVISFSDGAKSLIFSLFVLFLVKSGRSVMAALYICMSWELQMFLLPKYFKFK